MFRFRTRSRSRPGPKLGTGFGAAFFGLLAPAAPCPGQLISEFMAVNNTTLQDGDGDYPDWIEIHNPGAAPVDLDGWHLTDRADDLTRWTFSAAELEPGGFLVVFASGKDRDDPGGELHANFRLDGDGEFLALVEPDGETVASAFDPYPAQLPDVAYGALFSEEPTAVVEAGAPVAVHVPTAGTGPSLGLEWTEPDYVTGTHGEAWTAGETGVGYDAPGGELLGLLGAGGDIGEALRGTGAGAYLRLEFELVDPGTAGRMELQVHYDDGFVAYLNGEEVARANVPGAANGQSPEAGLMAYYSFDDELADAADRFENHSGATGDDLTARTSGGALNTEYQAGVVGRAVRVSRAAGQAAHLQAADSPDLRLGADWTVEAFVHPDAANTGEWDRFLAKWFGGFQEYHFAFRGANNGLDLFLNGHQVINQANTATVPLNRWSHVAMTGDSSGGATGIKVWLDGVVVGTAPYEAVAGGASPLDIGNRSATQDAGLQFSGLVDELAIWNVALSAGQLRSHAGAIGRGDAGGAEAYGLTPAGGGAGDELAWDSTAAAERPEGGALEAETIDLTARRGLLRAGRNVLAIHGLKADLASDDFLLLPRLVLVETAAVAGEAGYLSVPTPGVSNGDGGAAPGPLITAVSHRPAAPAPGEDIVVTAEVAEAGGGPASVELVYRVRFGPETRTAMADDGSGPDAAAGDGVFTGTISGWSILNPQLFDPGEMVRWYVAAEDGGGGSSRSPAHLDPSGSAQYHGTVVADPDLETALPVLHWFVQNTGAANIGSGTRASLAYGGEFYDNVFVRIRGDTARNWPKKSYKFDFNDGDDFRFDPDLPRVNEINVNTTFTDKSYLRTFLSYRAYADTGGRASVAFPLRVHQNGDFFSVAQFVEQPDRDYLRRHGLDDRGALYKMKANGIGGAANNNATSGIQKKNRREEDFADMQALIDGMRLPEGAGKEAFVFDHVDLPSVVNYMAASVVIQNIDRTVKNFYLYRDTEGTGEWHFFPWDVDLAFGPNALNTNAVVSSEDTGNGSSHPFMGTRDHRYTSLWNGILQAVIEGRRTREMFLRRLRTQMDAHLATSYFEDLVDEHVARMEADVALDRARWGGNAHFGGGTRSFREEAARIVEEYLGPRRTHLFVTHAGPGAGAVGIPPTQGPAMEVAFGDVVFRPGTGDPDQEYLTLVNRTPTAVDLSGWTVSGAVDYTFAPGTVIPAAGSILNPSRGRLYLARDVAAFRRRPASPTGGERLFVQGGYRGQLSARGETLELRDGAGRLVAEVSYAGDPSPAQRFLRITEIYYAPGGDGDPGGGGGPFEASDFEYIELTNTGDAPLALDGVSFVQGVRFEFPAGFEIGPGEYVLVVKNAAATAARFGGDIRVAGEFTGQLNNGGEAVRLRDAEGENILSFTYDDRWFPPTRDGGFSLVARDAAAAFDRWDDPAHWGISTRPGGNPGAGDPEVALAFAGWKNYHFTAAERDDEGTSGPGADRSGDGVANLLKYAFGLDPARASRGGLPAPELAGDGGGDVLALRFRRQRRALDLEYVVEASSDLETWEVVPAQNGPPVDNGDGTETVEFRDGAPAGPAPHRSIRLRVRLLE